MDDTDAGHDILDDIHAADILLASINVGDGLFDVDNAYILWIKIGIYGFAELFGFAVLFVFAVFFGFGVLYGFVLDLVYDWLLLFRCFVCVSVCLLI